MQNWTMARHFKWTEEELLLALHLYLKRSRRVPRKTSLESKELSALLNSLPIHHDLERGGKFRTPDSVTLKIENIKAKDPFFEKQHLEGSKKGMTKGGQGVVELWKKYGNRLDEIPHDAEALLEKYRDALVEGVPAGRDDTAWETDRTYVEGGRKLALRSVVSRDRELARRKILETLAQRGRLDCEVCGFNFYRRYGEIGRYFAECHHLVPLAEGESTNSLADLAVLCSNCHSMIHTSKPPFSVAELRRIVHQNNRDEEAQR